MQGRKRKFLLKISFGIFLIAGLVIGCSDDDDDDNEDAQVARWTFLVWMNGDNNLEYLISHDLNELETVGSGDGIHVIVQADRIEGFSTDDGDWVGTRRYYIDQDGDPETVTSSFEELGEIDMGDPAAVSDFLLWAQDTWPAERYAIIFWDHGDGWSKERPDGNLLQAKGVSWDDSSGNFISIAEGDMRAALADMVSLRGPIDIIGFDACNMAAWEVAHSLRDQALIMTASEAWVGDEGFTYGPVLTMMKQDPPATSADIAREMCRGPVMDGGELTYSAIDIAGMETLATAIDRLAGGVLDNSTLEPLLMSARDIARGADNWKNWYLDLRDLAAVLSTTSGDAFLIAAGNDITAALDQSVIVSYSNYPYEWVGGLHIFFNLDWVDFLDLYHSGTGATWAQATRWDELLLVLASKY